MMSAAAWTPPGAIGPHGAAHPTWRRRVLATPLAVILGLTYNFLPFMVLPLYASLEKQDLSLLQAAGDLYYSSCTSFWTIPWPLSLPGVLGVAVRACRRARPVGSDGGAGDENAALPAGIEHGGGRGVVARVQCRAIDRRKVVVVGLLDRLEVIELRKLRKQVVRHVRSRALRDVVEDDRPVGGG